MAEYSVPTPKTPRRHASKRDDRFRIETLYFEAGFTIDDICLQLNITRGQVRYALEHRLTPQHYKRGRPPTLSTPQRKRLIQWVTASADNRRVPWAEIPPILGWDCGEKAIRAAFKKEGYVRRIARRKPPLTDEHMKERLNWAWEHLLWTEEQWFSVCWSDETWANPGRHRKAYITRKIGPDEVYDRNCIESRYQRKIGWMFWGGISGLFGRGPRLFGRRLGARLQL
jgi:hypothetical protein